MSDNDPNQDQKIPVTPAPPIEQQPESQPPTSIDGVRAPTKIPDKNQATDNKPQDNHPVNTVHGLNKQKQSSVSLAIVVTVIIVIIIAGLVIYAYSKSK